MNSTLDVECSSNPGGLESWAWAGVVLTLPGILNGVIGSLLVLLAVVVKGKLKQVKNAVVTFLTVPDLLMLIVLYVANVDTYLHQRWRYGPALCHINPILAGLFVSSSMLMQTVIAVQKYSIFFHKSKVLYNKSSIYLAFVVSWLLPVLVFMVDLINALEDDSDPTPSCLCCIYYGNITNLVKWTVAVGFVSLPCAVCTACYTRILLRVRNAVVSRTNPRAWTRKDVQLTKMFAVSLLVMTVGSLPFSALQVFDSNRQVPGVYYMVFASLHCLATGSNVWVYGFMHKDFRDAYKEVFRRLTCELGCGHTRSSQGHATSTVSSSRPPDGALFVTECRGEQNTKIEGKKLGAPIEPNGGLTTVG